MNVQGYLQTTRAALASWERGDYIDRWSVVHALGGMTAGSIAALYSADFFPSLVIVLLLAVLWEAFELFVNINETLKNRGIDVAIALLTFVFTYWFITLAFESRFVRILITMILVLWTLRLSYTGWHAWFTRNA